MAEYDTQLFPNPRAQEFSGVWSRAIGETKPGRFCRGQGRNYPLAGL